MTEPLLRMIAITKRFPGVVALDGVGLEVAAGEVHGLLGENGAGKSTLLKILSGAQAPDDGSIVFAGETVSFAAPYEAQRRGIVTIYQEFNLIPSLTVAENILIGREPGRAGLVDWSAMHRAAKAALDRIGLAIDPRRLVRDLSVAEQQMVEIARALSMDSRLIVMDEPTSALSAAEVERLMAIIRALRDHGIAVIYVTHRLDEVMAVCDRITVLRDGRLVGGAEVASVTVDDIIRMMVGRDLGALARIEGGAAQAGPPALRVEGITTERSALNPHATVLHGVSLAVRRGEILGIAGLVGAGRTELARAIFGADARAGGRILVEDRPVEIRSPADAIRHGIGLVPEDRKQQALFLSLAIRSNLAIAALGKLAGLFGYVPDSRERGLVEEYRRALGIRMAGPEQPIANLSGGNQQKVVLARWLALRPKVLIVDEPTRGIDVAAKAEVHQLLGRLAQEGIAVIAISSELPEVLAISDRIVAMCEGRITGEVDRAEADEETLMRLMTPRRAA
ncbi:sugar ABC transporter ATP-binding protein [Inquilinus limosus]|uniref:sugar ABC transporter ATP-binding protein n=1 Tax=Inquilinus limosus TaxID=171674 RepID=UPI00041513B8|nr:sugar ABC transporter ATP-binding protein [Inquilinus limosus]